MGYVDDMVTAYVECAIWAGLDWSQVSDGENDNPRQLDENYSADDVPADVLATIRNECQQFYDSERVDIGDMDAEQCGHDFYLTRNGHGAGFWDRGLGARGERLSQAAKVWGESEFYVGDDGKLYLP